MLLEDAVKEYTQRIRKNRGVGGPIYNTDVSYNFDSPGKPEGRAKRKNNFDVEVYLIQQMRKAYETGNKDALAEIPQHHGWLPGTNTVAFHFGCVEGVQVFDNETTGDHIYLISSMFGTLAASGRPTEFLEYLYHKMEEFKTERNAICNEIQTSPAHVELLVKYFPKGQQVYDSGQHCRWEREKGRDILMSIYRDEEFKRKDRVIDLCNKAEHIFECASNLYEGLKQSVPFR